MLAITHDMWALVRRRQLRNLVGFRSTQKRSYTFSCLSFVSTDLLKPSSFHQQYLFIPTSIRAYPYAMSEYPKLETPSTGLLP